MEERLIDSGIPYLEELNKHSRMERLFRPGSGAAKLTNIHYWPARRPCSLARPLTLASVLPKEVEAREFKDLIGIGAPKKMLYMIQPDVISIDAACRAYLGKGASEITVVDPMAGGGAIPLESARVGFRTIAGEYNPLAYLILRATVEFPAKYATTGLFERTLREANRMINWAKQEFKKYYSEDAENYIFARGIKCRYCDGLIPFAGLGSTITRNDGYKDRYFEVEFDKNRKSFRTRTADKKPASEKWLKMRRGGMTINVECPYCGKFFALRGKGETAFSQWFKRHYEVIEAITEMYQPAEDFSNDIISLHIPLIKQVGDRFTAIADDESERLLLLNAFNDLSKGVQEGDMGNYIPADTIPKSNTWANPLRALTRRENVKWYILFNPSNC